MKLWKTLGTSLAVVLLVGSALADEGLKSGPQVGKGLTPFNPLHCNGATTGEKVCLV
jgi:hypothetical protein